jgi:hypothetical protein
VGSVVNVGGDGEDGGIDVGWVVAELEEESCGGGVGDGEGVAGVAVRNGLGVVEGWADGDCLQEEEVAAGYGAGLTGLWGTLQLGEHG